MLRRRPHQPVALDLPPLAVLCLLVQESEEIRYKRVMTATGGHLYPGEMDRYTDRLDEAAGDADAAKTGQIKGTALGDECVMTLTGGFGGAFDHIRWQANPNRKAFGPRIGSGAAAAPPSPVV